MQESTTVAADGTCRRNSDDILHVDIKMTLQRVDALEAIRRPLPEVSALSADNHQDGSGPAPNVEGAS